MFLRLVLTVLVTFFLLSTTMGLMAFSVHGHGHPLHFWVAPLTAFFFLTSAFAIESIFKQKEILSRFTSTMAYQRLTGLAKYRQLLKF